MGVMGVVNVYISRNNITIAVVPMVNQTYLKLERASRIELNTESNLSVSIESELQCSHASVNESHLGWFKLWLHYFISNVHGNFGTKIKPYQSVSRQKSDGPLKLTESQQGTLLAAYYLGYTANQIPSGFLAYRFGFKRVLLAGIGLGSLLTLAFPFVIKMESFGYQLAVCIRILLGICHVSHFYVINI